MAQCNSGSNTLERWRNATAIQHVKKVCNAIAIVNTLVRVRNATAISTHSTESAIDTTEKSTLSVIKQRLSPASGGLVVDTLGRGTGDPRSNPQPGNNAKISVSVPVYALLMRGNNPETPVSSADNYPIRET